MNHADTTRKRANRIDWRSVHRRLEQARNTIEATGPGDSGVQEQVLRERAAAMAKPLLPASTRKADALELLVFSLAGEQYAFETAFVAQAWPLPGVTPIPGTPDHVVGIVAVEGEIMSVIDLRSLLDLPLSGLAEPTTMIALKDDAMEFCVLAEGIAGIEYADQDDLQHDLPTLGGNETTYLKGVTARRIAVLDAEQLLADPRLVIDMG